MRIDGVLYIGKESTNYEIIGILGTPDYTKYNDSTLSATKLLQMTPKDAKSIGIARNTLFYMKKRAKSGTFRLSKKIRCRLMRAMEVI